LDASKKLGYSIIYRKQYITTILEGYVDADWANHEDRKSVTGYIFKVYGSIISWSTNNCTLNY